MHDIGKIGIPDDILLKAGKLNAEEWRIMKSHTIIGANILIGSKIGFVRMGAMIALTHHEKWDGSGYPNGLKGRQIPLAGRIVALADVFDALTSKRTYKEPFPVQESNRIIEEGQGTHFDPEVVDAFFAVQAEILQIKAMFEDRHHDPVDLMDRAFFDGSVNSLFASSRAAIG
jgi:putative two-component system response regulator